MTKYEDLLRPLRSAGCRVFKLGDPLAPVYTIVPPLPDAVAQAIARDVMAERLMRDAGDAPVVELFDTASTQEKL